MPNDPLRTHTGAWVDDNLSEKRLAADYVGPGAAWHLRFHCCYRWTCKIECLVFQPPHISIGQSFFFKLESPLRQQELCIFFGLGVTGVHWTSKTMTTAAHNSLHRHEWHRGCDGDGARRQAWTFRRGMAQLPSCTEQLTGWLHTERTSLTVGNTLFTSGPPGQLAGSMEHLTCGPKHLTGWWHETTGWQHRTPHMLTGSRHWLDRTTHWLHWATGWQTPHM